MRFCVSCELRFLTEKWKLENPFMYRKKVGNRKGPITHTESELRISSGVQKVRGVRKIKFIKKLKLCALTRGGI